MIIALLPTILISIRILRMYFVPVTFVYFPIVMIDIGDLRASRCRRLFSIKRFGGRNMLISHICKPTPSAVADYRGCWRIAGKRFQLVFQCSNNACDLLLLCRCYNTVCPETATSIHDCFIVASTVLLQLRDNNKTLRL